MKYQNNKDLAEAQYYLKMLDDFCKSGQVKIPDPTGSVMPWDLKEDPLKDYLIHLFTLKVTIPETGEEVQKFMRQVVNSKIKSKVFYDCVGKFIVECVHHMRFQRQRAWTESHRADDVLDWTPFKRMDEQVWLPLIDQLEQEHREDGFDKFRYLKVGVSVLLVFIGVKMLIHDFFEIDAVSSLVFIILVLLVSIGASVVIPQKKEA
jgi:hypothetical protein